MPDLKPFADVDLFFAAGVWHPLLLHMPVALLVALVAIELRAMLTKAEGADLGRSTVVLLLAIFGPLAAATGWALHETGEYRGIEWHERLGIATGIASLVVAIAYWKGAKAYRPLVFVSAILMSIAGHLGADITHGKNYVLEPWLADDAPRQVREAADKGVAQADAASNPREVTTGDAVGNGAVPNESTTPDTPSTNVPSTDLPSVDGPSPIADATPLTLEQAIASFDANVLPIFDEYCTRCHGDRKRKEGLRVDSYEGVMAGSEWGAVITPGNPAESRLVETLHLPLDDDAHMPPEDKRQLEPEHIAAIEAWVQSHP